MVVWNKYKLAYQNNWDVTPFPFIEFFVSIFSLIMRMVIIKTPEGRERVVQLTEEAFESLKVS